MNDVKAYRDYDNLDYAELNAGRTLPVRPREPGTPRFALPERFEPVATSADGASVVVICGECGSVSDPIPHEECVGTAWCGECFEWGFNFDLVAMSPEEKESYVFDDVGPLGPDGMCPVPQLSGPPFWRSVTTKGEES